MQQGLLGLDGMLLGDGGNIRADFVRGCDDVPNTMGLVLWAA